MNTLDISAGLEQMGEFLSLLKSDFGQQFIAQFNKRQLTIEYNKLKLSRKMLKTDDKQLEKIRSNWLKSVKESGKSLKNDNLLYTQTIINEKFGWNDLNGKYSINSELLDKLYLMYDKYVTVNTIKKYLKELYPNAQFIIEGHEPKKRGNKSIPEELALAISKSKGILSRSQASEIFNTSERTIQRYWNA